MDITVTVKCPDLAIAAAALAKAILGAKESNEGPTHATPQGVVASGQHPANTPTPVPTAGAHAADYPSSQNPTPGAAQQTYIPAGATTAPNPIPAAPLPTAVPTAPAPQITPDMVAKAGAELIRDHREMMGPLNALLQKYGVPDALHLSAEQIGPFSTEMRAMGAKI